MSVILSGANSTEGRIAESKNLRGKGEGRLGGNPRRSFDSVLLRSG